MWQRFTSETLRAPLDAMRRSPTRRPRIRASRLRQRPRPALPRRRAGSGHAARYARRLSHTRARAFRRLLRAPAPGVRRVYRAVPNASEPAFDDAARRDYSRLIRTGRSVHSVRSRAASHAGRSGIATWFAAPAHRGSRRRIRRSGVPAGLPSDECGGRLGDRGRVPVRLSCAGRGEQFAGYREPRVTFKDRFRAAGTVCWSR
jgi:hypothetical protein